MTTKTETDLATQVYRVYIKATPEKIWDAITKPEWSERYGYTALNYFDLRPGGAYKSYPSEAMKKGAAELGYPTPPDVIVDGEVIEADPPHRLVHTWRMLMDPGMAAEGFTRLTWEIDELEAGLSKLTVIHELEGAPLIAALVAGEMESEGAGGGWAETLSGLKTLLETGEELRS